MNSTPGTLGRQDAPKFRNLVLIVVAVGIVFATIFHIGVKEKPKRKDSWQEHQDSSSCKKIRKTTWTAWLKETQFWQIGMIYMMTRLIVNLSQVYIPLFVTDSLFLDKKTIAIIPLVIYISGICATIITKPLSSFCGLKITYFVGLVLLIAASCWLWILGGLPSSQRHQIYGASIVLGLGCSTLLVTSLAMTAELVGDNTSTGAFIYGAMSFFDKVANGVAVMLIQKLHPGTDATPGGHFQCPTCAHYYRIVISFLPGGAAVLALFILATLAKSKIGSNNSDPKDHSNYGSVESHPKNTLVNEEGDRLCPSQEVLSSHASLLGCTRDEDDESSTASPKELYVCAENCRCKICVNDSYDSDRTVGSIQDENSRLLNT